MIGGDIAAWLEHHLLRQPSVTAVSTIAGFEPKGATPQQSPWDTAAQTSLTPPLQEAQFATQTAVTLSNAAHTSTRPDAQSFSQDSAQPSAAAGMSVTVGTEQPVSHALHTTVSMQSDAGCPYAVETQPADLQTASAAEQTAANSTAGESVSMLASISLTSRPAESSPSADVTAPGSTRAVLTALGSKSTRADTTAPGSKSCQTGLTAPGSKSPAAALAAPEGVMGPWSIKASSRRLNAAD